MRNVLRRISSKLNFGIEKVFPDSFVFCVALVIIVFFAGMFIAGQSALNMVKYFGDGFWGFLAFTMQMVALMVVGSMVATSPLGHRFMKALARIPKSSVAAVVFVTIATSFLTWLQWGLGLIAGGILCREIAKRMDKLDFKLLVAGSYTGWSIGLFGLSNTESLIVNTPGHFMEKTIGLIPMTQTALSPMMLTGIALCTLFAALLFYLVHPDTKDTPVVSDRVKKMLQTEENGKTEMAATVEASFADKLQNSPIINWAAGIIGAVYVVNWFATKGFNLNLDIFNLMLLFLALFLHSTPMRFMNAAKEACSDVYGIVVQFPFYAGIQGMMASSGLVVIMSDFFVSISTAASFPYWNYLCGAITNFFIPSSGGIWMVQGPIMVEAGKSLGVAAPMVINSFAAGEVFSNMIQPFWALPLLSMAGLEIRDIVGYCIMAFVIVTAVFFGVMMVF